MRPDTQPDSAAWGLTARSPGRRGLRVNDAWRDYAWPCILIPLVLGGIVLSVETRQTTYANALATVRSALYWRPFGPETKEQPVLVVVANRDREMQVIATLSPRGFKAQRAKDVNQVKEMFAGAAPAFAVIDSSTPGAAAISRFLKTQLPANRIVVLNRSTPREAIGQILLNRL